MRQLLLSSLTLCAYNRQIKFEIISSHSTVVSKTHFISRLSDHTNIRSAVWKSWKRWPFIRSRPMNACTDGRKVSNESTTFAKSSLNCCEICEKWVLKTVIEEMKIIEKQIIWMHFYQVIVQLWRILFVTDECRLLSGDSPDVSSLLCEAMAGLQDRPVLFR